MTDPHAPLIRRSSISSDRSTELPNDTRFSSNDPPTKTASFYQPSNSQESRPANAIHYAKVHNTVVKSFFHDSLVWIARPFPVDGQRPSWMRDPHDFIPDEHLSHFPEGLLFTCGWGAKTKTCCYPNIQRVVFLVDEPC